MTNEEGEKLRQELPGSGSLDAEHFQRCMAVLLPEAKEGAIPIWAKFAAELVESKQYVRFIEEPDREAVCRWHDTLLAGFVLLAEHFGRESAEKVCNLSLEGCCLYPFEMERAAQELQAGASIDELACMMQEGQLEAETIVFPELHEVMSSLASSDNTPKITMNMEELM